MLERAINILMILVIPIAVSVHTVISYIFAMTLQPGWHSTIFGPYFVVGAIYSGIAALFLVMITFRRVYRLERYLKDIHLQQLSRLLLIMALVWFYFTFSEYLTGYYGGEPAELKIILYKAVGPYKPAVLAHGGGDFDRPGRPARLQTPAHHERNPGRVGGRAGRDVARAPDHRRPHVGEPGALLPHHPLRAVVGRDGAVRRAVAVFCIGFTLFAKFFPLISIWEVEEGLETGKRDADARVHSYQPDIFGMERLDLARRKHRGAR